jgi:hypothetical protein
VVSALADRHKQAYCSAQGDNRLFRRSAVARTFASVPSANGVRRMPKPDRREFLKQAVQASAAAAVAGAMPDLAHAASPPSSAASAGEARRTLAIRDVTLFDAPAARMRAHQTVVIEGERISAVGDAASTPVPPGARIIDGTGRWVIPGLIDAHVHLTHVLYQARMTGDEVLPLWLAHGVTSVRSTGDNVPAQRLLQRWVAAHPGGGPRIFPGSFLIDGAVLDHNDVGWSLTDPAQVAPFVADMAAWGVQTLKLYVGCERAVGQRVIAEGHAHGLAVAGHLEAYHPRDAVADGIDSLEHIYTVADFIRDDPKDRHSVDIHSDLARRFIDEIAAKGTAVDPTLMVFWGTLFFADQADVVEHPDNALVPRQLRDYWRADNPRRFRDFSSGPLAIRQRTFRTYQELTGLLHKAGVPILVGTDAAEPQVTPGASLHHEMAFLVESGLSPAEVLRAATLGNATILRQQAHLGSIQRGKLADLVLLDADPTVRIDHSRRIRQVVQGGVVHEPAAVMARVKRD